VLFSGVIWWQWKQSQQRQALSAQISNAALLKLEIQELPHRSKDRQAMREEALQVLQSAVAAASYDQALLRQVASGFRRLGDLAADNPALDMGSAQDAVSYFNRARSLLERASTDAAVRLDFAALKASLGSGLALLGQTSEAANQLGQSVVELEGLPVSVINRDRELARALLRLARLNFEQAKPGRPLLERSLSLHRALSIGGAVADQLAWIRCLQELSWAEMQAGDGLDKAQAYAIQAVEATRALRLRYPNRLVLDVSLADALAQLAQVLVSRNLSGEAAAVGAESMSLILSLHQKDPANAPLASYLAGRYFVLGDMQHSAGAYESAQLSFEKSYQVAFQLSQTEPTNSQYAIDAALAKAYVGQEAMERKRYAEARMEIGIALRLFESRPEAAKGEIGWLSSYGIALGQMARSFARAGDPAAAGGIYEKLLANQELVLAKAPSRPALRLAAALKYAEAAQNRREWARGVDSKQARAALLSEAKEWNQQALDMLLDLEAKQQLDPRWLPYLQAARKGQLVLQ
jgi:tetratricopeptide (TPR) repeat protein